MKPARLSTRARVARVALAAQPFAAAPVFISAIAGNPPMWAAWAIALAPWALYLALSGRVARRTPFDIAIAVFVAGLLVGLWVTPDKTVGAEAFQTTLACILIYYGLVNNAYAGRRFWLALAGIMGLVALWLSAWFFSQDQGRHFAYNAWLFSLASALPRMPGPSLGIHSLGMLLAVGAPVLAAVSIHHGERSVRLRALAVCLALLAVLFLVSSGAGGIAVAFGLMFVLATWRPWTLGATIPGVGAAAAFTLLDGSRFAWLAKTFPSFSMYARTLYWQRTLDFMRESPILGLGLGNWAKIQEDQYHWLVVNAHSSYLQLYADTGVLGIAAAAIACIALIRVSRSIAGHGAHSAWQAVGIGTIGAIVAGGAGSVFEVVITGAFKTDRYHYIGIPLLWMLAALLVVCYRRACATSQPCTTGKEGRPRNNTLR